ncbi:MAG: peptide chain release factor N(5)-glutamine methyltransferase [Gammaproteobacteria bacterium]|nr:peptide chain release factor N(5)-glutamine methyltransferase [Gammaproteobacteria bacterium]MCI0590067.1 peptide chain release factor N(5)-glutamine methyltransferase [Gammaproteobacteria bacterium]
MKPIIKHLLDKATNRLSHLPSARRDAEVLLCKVLGADRAYLCARSEEIVAEVQSRHFERLVSERASGWPLAYLIGVREFWSIALYVTADTLIPRPETEHLVETALRHLPSDQSCAADLGTGSGAVALAIAQERPRCQIVATDISRKALAVAERNARRLGVNQITFRQGDWCDVLADEAYDLILSNPPYIPDNDPHLSQGDLRFEPPEALRGGLDGLAAARRIIDEAPNCLNAGGWLLLEHGYDQGALVQDRLRQSGFDSIRTYSDYAGHERVTEGQHGGP